MMEKVMSNLWDNLSEPIPGDSHVELLLRVVKLQRSCFTSHLFSQHSKTSTTSCLTDFLGRILSSDDSKS